MPVKRRSKGSTSVIRTEDDFLDAFQEWDALSKQASSIKKRTEVIKASMMAWLEDNGEETEEGHLYFDFGDEINGYQGAFRQKRSSSTFNEDVARKIIEKHGLEDDCLVLIEVVDQDALLAAHFKEEITQEEMDRIITTETNWAFVGKKAK